MAAIGLSTGGLTGGPRPPASASAGSQVSTNSPPLRGLSLVSSEGGEEGGRGGGIIACACACERARARRRAHGLYVHMHACMIEHVCVGVHVRPLRRVGLSRRAERAEGERARPVGLPGAERGERAALIGGWAAVGGQPRRRAEAGTAAASQIARERPWAAEARGGIRGQASGTDL